MVAPLTPITDGVASGWRLFRHFMADTEDGLSGVAAIEFSIIATMFVLMSITTADIGMGFYRKMQVQNAAQAGARYAMLKGLDTAGIVNAINLATRFEDIVAADPDVFYGCASAEGITPTYQNATCPDGETAGRYVTVSTQAAYMPILPIPLLPSSYNFQAQSTVRMP